MLWQRKKDRFVDDIEWFDSRVHCLIDKAIVSFCNRFRSWVAATGKQWHWEVCLNTKWAISIWHSWWEHLNCWWKAAKNLICYSCLFNVHPPACSLEKVNFKV